MRKIDRQINDIYDKLKELEKRIDSIDTEIGFESEDTVKFLRYSLIDDYDFTNHHFKPYVNLREELRLIKEFMGVKLVKNPEKIELTKIKKGKK